MAREREDCLDSEIYLPYSKILISQSLVQGSLSRMALVIPRFRLLSGMPILCRKQLYLVAAPPTCEVGDLGQVWEPLCAPFPTQWG